MHSRLFRKGSGVLSAAIFIIVINPEAGLANSPSSAINTLYRNEDSIHSKSAVLSQTPDLVQITGIQIISAGQGIDVVIETAGGEALEGAFSIDGNSLVINIPNAALQNGPFLRTNPIAGIASIARSPIDSLWP